MQRKKIAGQKEMAKRGGVEANWAWKIMMRHYGIVHWTKS